MIPVAMTIAGSDPSGGAGIQADLKTFHQHGVYGTSIVTLLTVQNTQSVSAIKILDSNFLLAQLEAVLEDILPQAAKIGALGSVANIKAIAQRAKSFSFPFVLDPVMVSKHGHSLIDDDAVKLIATELLPAAFLVTPNLPEASRLAAMEVNDLRTMERAAEVIARHGVKHVLIKGGHLGGDAVDVLWTDGQAIRLRGERIDTQHTHGTGCVLSAAITARLASGEDVLTAVTASKRFITEAIRTNPCLGHGYGPVNMHAIVHGREPKPQ